MQEAVMIGRINKMGKYTKEEILNIIDRLRNNIQSNYKTGTDFWEKKWSNKKQSVSLIILEDFVSLVMRKKGDNK